MMMPNTTTTPHPPPVGNHDDYYNKNDDETEDLLMSDYLPLMIEEETEPMMISHNSNNNNHNNNNNAGINNNTNHKNNDKNDDEKSTTSTWEVWRKQSNLFCRMAAPYFKESITGRWYFISVILLQLIIIGLNVLLLFLKRHLMNAIVKTDTAQFYEFILKYLITFIFGIPLSTYAGYQEKQLKIHWREWMTTRTIKLYTQNRVYYNLELQQRNMKNNNNNKTNNQNNNNNNNGWTNQQPSTSSDTETETKATTTTTITKFVDNPDQRIAHDINSFTIYSLQFIIKIMISIINMLSVSTVLFTIDQGLFIVLILYATLGTYIVGWLGQPLLPLNEAQLRREADLRYLLVRWRDNAESIAFYGGEELEGRDVGRKVQRVMDNRRSINKAERNLDFFYFSYKYLVVIIPYVVVAPRYFAGTLDFGAIQQAYSAFHTILEDLSLIVNSFESLSAFSAGIERLSSFYEAIRHVDDTRNNMTTPLLDLSDPSSLNQTTTTTTTPNGTLHDTGATTITNNNVNWNDMTHEQPVQEEVIRLKQYAPSVLYQNSLINNPIVVLSIQDVDLYTPDGKRPLVRQLNLEVLEGEHLLIVGDSGRGKSSLLRCIAGLWKTGRGTITRLADDDVYFLPQRPYCSVGSLKDQLLYPSLEEEEVMEQYQLPRTTTRTASNNNSNAHRLKRTLSDDDLLHILEQVDLLNVAKRAGNGDAKIGLLSIIDWTNVLSLGEQQRLAFGRLLVNQPRLVILDEATSALDMKSEAKMYALLKNNIITQQQQQRQQQSQGVVTTYISVGHRPSLLNYHNKRLHLLGESEFEFSNIGKELSEHSNSPPHNS